VYDSLGTLMLMRVDGTGHQSLLYCRRAWVVAGIAWSPDCQWILYQVTIACPSRRRRRAWS